MRQAKPFQIRELSSSDRSNWRGHSSKLGLTQDRGTTQRSCYRVRLIKNLDFLNPERIHLATRGVLALSASRNNRVIERFFAYLKQVVGFGGNLAARFFSRLIWISNDERPPVQINLSEQSLSGYEFFLELFAPGRGALALAPIYPV